VHLSSHSDPKNHKYIRPTDIKRRNWASLLCTYAQGLNAFKWQSPNQTEYHDMVRVIRWHHQNPEDLTGYIRDNYVTRVATCF